jgi:hypothetical protein
MENKLFTFQRFYCAKCDIVYSADDLMDKTIHTCPVCDGEPNKKFLNDLSLGSRVTFLAKKEMVLPKYDEKNCKSKIPLTFQKNQSIFGYIRNVFFETKLGGTCIELSLGSLGYTIIPLLDFYMDKEYLKNNTSNTHQIIPKSNSKFSGNQTNFEFDPELFKTYISKYDSDGRVDAILVTLRSLEIKESDISQIVSIVNENLKY